MRALLFDFFGTLVEFEAGRTADQVRRAHRLASEGGYGGSIEEFHAQWDLGFVELEAESRRTLVEFPMVRVAERFLAANPTIAGVDATTLGATYVQEWSEHVLPIDGLEPMLRRLADDWQIAVVSNTHDADMVPRLLGEMGIADLVAVTVLSVDHGRTKPHSSIYESTLERLGLAAPDCVFVGDSLGPDYEGPIGLGMDALLIDPQRRHAVPETARIDSVLQVEERLAV